MLIWLHEENVKLRAQIEEKRPWRELTSEETKVLWNQTKKASAFAQLISNKLKEKNA